MYLGLVEGRFAWCGLSCVVVNNTFNSIMKEYSYALHSKGIAPERMKCTTLNGLEETTVLLLLNQCSMEIHKLRLVKSRRVIYHTILFNLVAGQAAARCLFMLMTNIVVNHLIVKKNT